MGEQRSLGEEVYCAYLVDAFKDGPVDQFDFAGLNTLVVRIKWSERLYLWDNLRI